MHLIITSSYSLNNLFFSYIQVSLIVPLSRSKFYLFYLSLSVLDKGFRWYFGTSWEYIFKQISHFLAKVYLFILIQDILILIWRLIITEAITIQGIIIILVIMNMYRPILLVLWVFFFPKLHVVFEYFYIFWWVANLDKRPDKDGIWSKLDYVIGSIHINLHVILLKSTELILLRIIYERAFCSAKMAP